MADNIVATIYPFAERCQVTTNAQESVDVWDIPAGTIITMVLAKISTAGTGSGNIIIGDDDSDNGYVLAADATAAADTVYGDKPTERGTYLEGTAGEPGDWKVYVASGKEVKMDCSATLTTEATVDVMIFGYRYAED